MTEYTILLTIVMVCSVVGLLSAGSRAMRQIAADKNLCKLEGKDCEGVEPRVTSEGEGASTGEGEGEASEEGEAGDEGSPEGGEASEGEDGDGAQDLDAGSNSGTSSGSDSAPVSAWDQFWGPLASNPMVMGFAGIMGWFV